MRKTKLWLALLLMALFATLQHTVFAQDQTGKLHGHVQDPAGVALPNASVQLSTDGKTALYTFTTDSNGDYTGANIKPGTYIVTVYQASKPVDRFENVKITAGGDTLQDFDMSRAAYIAKMTPEQKKQLEALKKTNAEAMKENGQIKNLNADLIKARQDNKDKNYAEAESLMAKDTAAKPDASVLWLELGTAQAGQKKWDDAATSFKKVIALEGQSKKPNPEVIAATNNQLGEVYANQSKAPEAEAAYTAAATANPTQAAMYYTNEAIVLSRTGQTDATVAAADKAIAADPTKPIPYYLKGQALISKATVDPKTQKIVAPPGCAEAYQKYLDLAPNGPFAPAVKSIMQEMGQTVHKSYRKR